MTYSGLIMWIGTSKTPDFLDFWHPFSWRLWRTGMLLLTKSKGHKSNSPYSGFPNHLQTKSNLHISICQSQIHYVNSRWDTLYPAWIQLKNNFGPIVPLFQFSDLEWKALLTHSFCQLPETSKRTTLELSNSYPILNCWVLESFFQKLSLFLKFCLRIVYCAWKNVCHKVKVPFSCWRMQK